MFFFSSRRRHTRCLSDWSSDVCSSDLTLARCANCCTRCERRSYSEPNPKFRVERRAVCRPDQRRKQCFSPVDPSSVKALSRESKQSLNWPPTTARRKQLRHLHRMENGTARKRNVLGTPARRSVLFIDPIQS